MPKSDDYPDIGDNTKCLSCGGDVRVGERHSCTGGITKLRGKRSTVIADSREKLSHPFPSQALPAGDYLVTTPGGLTILVERKTHGDLTGSFLSGRLHKQLWRMAEGYADRVVLLVEEGPVPRDVHKVLKACLSYVKARVEPVMYVAYTDGYEETLKLLDYWKRKGDLVFYAHRPVKKATGSKDVLMALPGIGEATKEKIVRSRRFSNLTDFINNIDKAKDLVPKKVYGRLKSFVDQDWK